MGAFVDRSVRCIVKLNGSTPATGAFPLGRPFFCGPDKGRYVSAGGNKSLTPGRCHDGVKTWLICNHLATPEKFVANYAEYHYFVVFDSHVFCHDCHESNMAGGESAFLNMEMAASAMTDTELQQQIFEPFYRISFSSSFPPADSAMSSVPSKTWRVCHHLADDGNFRKHVFDGNIILFTDNNVACPGCLDVMLQKPGEDLGEHMVQLPESDLQYAIVNRLFSLNYELSLAQGFIH